MARLSASSSLQDRFLKQRRLVFEFDITANATPASKVHGDDLPGHVVLRSEGKTADADAIEDLSASFTTAVDATNGIFGCIVYGLDSIRKVHSITFSERGAATGTAIAMTKLGTAGLSAGGNIAFELTMTGTDLATESVAGFVSVEYLEV